VAVCIVLLMGGRLAAQNPDNSEASSRKKPGDANSTWEVIARHDKDKNGKVTSTEYTRGEEKFKRLDANSDGVLTKDDFSGGGNRREGMRGRGGRGDRGMRGGGFGGRGGGRGRGEMMGQMLLSRMKSGMDADSDGSVTTKEWKAFLKNADSDKDKILSQDELVDAGSPERMAEFASRTFDSNDDQKIQIGELDPVFERADADKNGILEGNEISDPRRGGRDRGGRGRERGRGQRGRGQRGGRDGQGSSLPTPGDMAPDFKLPVVGNKGQSITLSDFRGKRPVALIFGSYT